MTDLLQLLIAGLATGAIYALAAIGFTLLWQTSQTINFAQGEFVMVPAFFALIATNWLGVPFLLALLLSIAASLLLLGVAFRYVVVGPLLRQGVLPLVISTLALSILMKESVKDFYSAEAQVFPTLLPDTAFSLLGVTISLAQLGVLAVALVVILLLQWFLAGTRTGRQMQATAQNPSVARILGVPVERMILYTFLINAGLAAMASLLISPIYLAKFSNGETLGLIAFAAAIVGGFNQVRGAIAGGLLIGVLDNLAAAYVSTSYRQAVPLILLVLVILFRPQGLLGRREERAV
ncbi:branched-chain amino acid ABC transporter permease [Reyranella sp.]|uniref:branched-chain amino acid ABC transporter permease n=1 Tax=Reyranella sp. TaxID=1929291 RepID=UPI003782F9BB